MATLREEYSKHRADKGKAVNEAAIQWVLENVLLLNETFNREALQRLQGSISKFDSTFAPFAAKVPEVKKSLDEAEELMNRITMGEKVTRSDGRLRLTDEEKESIKEPATYMVKYLSLMYNNLSRFFNRDMKALMEFPIFRKALANPQTPLRDLAEADRMKKALLHALVPNSETTAILQRMYRSMDLPSLDYKQIADELLNLSASDFQQLMQVDKVPLVVSADKSTASMSPVQASPVAPAMEAATSTNPKVQSGDEILSEEEENLLKEIGEIDPNQLSTVVKGIQRVQGIVKGMPELANLNRDLESLRAQALTTVSKGGMMAGKKAQTIAATANMVYGFFDKLGELWPKLQPLIPTDRPLAEEELANIQQFMTRAQGGIMAKIGNWFQTRALPGLAPTQIAQEIMSVVAAGQQDPAKAIQATQSLSNLFQRLNQLKLPPATNPQGQPVVPGQTTPQAPQGAAGATGAAASAPASQSTQAAGTPQTQGAAPTASGPGPTPQSTTGAPGEVNIDAMSQQLTKAIGGELNANKTAVQKLVSAGWKISPPTK